jgi:predicted nucleic acid-binding protein
VTGWLLDTNILSELKRPKPEPKVVDFLATQRLERLFISTVTLAELRFGIERLTNHTRRADLHHWLTNQIRPMFDGRILPISEDVMLEWRLMVDEGRRIRHTFAQPDLIIAATASVFGMTVVTRNHTDFPLTRAPVFNPWVDDVPTAS